MSEPSEISKIKTARLKAGLSQAEMSRQFKIPVRTLQDWEAGKRSTPEWAELLIIEKLENISKSS
ncbi:MAG: helix-turn-helix domain-containing protein [Lachnospiraceae bacterium]|nr:helix-turn-helix domain-containing protein [Lachnospiraceae bacterium]